jgi:predicted NAD/FAD-dependent oxidoreductase
LSLLLRRRQALAGAAAALPGWLALGGLAGCRGEPERPALDARWVAPAVDRGHALRDPDRNGRRGSPAVAAPVRRVGALVIGAGIAGLAAARALMQRGVDDVHLLELEEAPGGNSRGHRLAGIGCPLGAHYLPLPGPQAHEVSEWLHQIGLLKTVLGRTVADERHLCHSPQERLFFDGEWVEGLLPPAAPGSATLAAYRGFARAVAAVQPTGFALPSSRAPWTAAHAALDAQTFDTWLSAQGFDDAALRWYLDYCCRDDYGADSRSVSAWAGLHYFASRHGFHAPGEGPGDGADDGVFTWPEGNAWLVERLAQPLGRDRLHGARTVLRVEEGKHGVEVRALRHADGALEGWSAPRVVLAVPLFVARRLLATPPPALAEAAAALAHAPWVVANLHVERPLLARPGAAPAWDNVVYGSPWLGYVDAQHQSLRAAPGPTVLSFYRPLAPSERPALLTADAAAWAASAIDSARTAHPELRLRVQRVDLARWGHAMVIPAPGVRGHPALAALKSAKGRLRFAHGDLAGTSVFEEAFTLGHLAGSA